MSLTEDERRAIVESGPVYLSNGLRATLGGWRDESGCSVASSQPGIWSCSWETAADVVARPNRRFRVGELRHHSDVWLGSLPAGHGEWQTEVDYQRALIRGDAY